MWGEEAPDERGRTVEHRLEAESDELRSCEREGHREEGTRGGEGGGGTGMDTGQREGTFCLICTLSLRALSRATKSCQCQPWTKGAGDAVVGTPFFHERTRPNPGRVRRPKKSYLAILVHPQLKGKLIIIILH